MAIDLRSATFSSENTNEFTPLIGEHESGDLIVGVYFGYFNNQNWQFSGSAQGFTMNENGAGTPRPMPCVIWKVATSDNETMPTIRQGTFPASSGSPYMGITRVFSGADTTTPIHAKAIETANLATDEFATVNTTSDDCLILLDHCIANAYAMVVAPPNANNHDAGNEAIQGSQELYTTHSWIPQETGGTSRNDITVYSDINGPITKLTVAIAPATADGIPVSIDPDNPPTEIINPLGGLTDSSFHNSVVGATYGRDHTTELSVIAGKGTNYQVPTSSVNMLSLNGISRTCEIRNPSNTDPNENHGAVLDTANCPDLTGKLVAVRHQVAVSQSAVPDLGGVLFGFRDSGAAYKIIPVGGKASTPNTNTPNTVVISMASTAHDASLTYVSGSPTFDPSLVNGLYMGHVKETAAQIRSTFSNARVINPVKLIGTATASMQKFQDAMIGSELETILNQRGGASGQWFLKQPIAATCPVADSNFSVEWVTASNGDNQQGNIDALDLGAEFSGNTTFTNALFSCSTRAYWTIVGVGAHNWNSLTLVNHLLTLALGATYSGTCAISGSPEIVHNGADLSGISKVLSGCVDDQYATISGTQSELQDLIDNWAKTTITDSPVYAYKIVHTEAGNISLNFPADYDVDMIRYEGDGSSELEAVMPEGSFLRNTSTSGGDSVRIVAVVPTLAIGSSEPSTVLRYGFENTQVIEASVIGQLLNYDFTVSTPIFIEALLPGFVPQNIPSQIPFDGPLNFTMVRDPVYNASHGLLEGTHYDWDRAGNQTLTLTGDQNIFDVRSSKSDEILFNAAFINTPLKLEAKAGLSRVDAIKGLVITNMSAWKRAGSEHFDVADPVNPVSKWFALVSTVNIAGASAYIRQVNSGAASLITLTNNIVDEVFQYYRDDNHDGDTSDTNEYDRSDYALVKAFELGKKQARVDVLANAGLTSLRSELYTIPLALEDHTYSGLNPGIIADLQLNLVNKTVGGAFFTYEWVDGATNTGADIVNQIHYSQVTTPNALVPGNSGLRWIDLPDMVQFNGNAVETERGLREGATVATVGFYVSQAGGDHPSFTLFQGDTTNYQPEVVATGQGSDMPSDGSHTELIVWNNSALSAPAWQASTAYSVGDLIIPTSGLGVVSVAGQFLRCTTAGVSAASEPTWSTTNGGTTNDGTAVFTTYNVLFQSGDPGGATWLDTYIDGQEFSSSNSEEFGWAFAAIKNGESYRYAENTGFVSSDGFQFSVANFITDPSYAADGVDGSTLTSRFTTDILNSEIDLIADTDFNSWELFAFYCYTQTLTAGLWNFRGGVIAEDGGYRIVVARANIFLDEILGVFIKQLDDRRIYRDTAPINPAKDPTTGALANEGGGGIAVNHYQRAFAVEVGSVAQATLDEVNAGVQALPTLAEMFAKSMTDGTFEQYLEDMYVRADLHRTKPNTYNPEGTQIVNSDFTVETDAGGQVSRTDAP